MAAGRGHAAAAQLLLDSGAGTACLRTRSTYPGRVDPTDERVGDPPHTPHKIVETRLKYVAYHGWYAVSTHDILWPTVLSI